MNMRELLKRQWTGYATYHRSRINLLVHIFVVPAFLAGNVGLIIGLLQRSWVLSLASPFVMLASVALQGLGHRQEPVPPEPFSGVGNAVSRIFFEQWITFPRFVVSGGWYRALRERAARGFGSEKSRLRGTSVD